MNKAILLIEYYVELGFAIPKYNETTPKTNAKAEDVQPICKLPDVHV